MLMAEPAGQRASQCVLLICRNSFLLQPERSSAGEFRTPFVFGRYRLAEGTFNGTFGAANGANLL